MMMMMMMIHLLHQYLFVFIKNIKNGIIMKYVLPTGGHLSQFSAVNGVSIDVSKFAVSTGS